MEDLIKRYPALSICEKDIQKALILMIDTYKNGGKILICGNGGSAADSEHIVGELMKGFVNKRPVISEKIPPELSKYLQGALPAISLPSQSSILSAYVNDVAPEMMYAQLVYGYGKENDLLICLSTSGNSLNIINAAKVAKGMGLNILSLSGKTGGILSDFSDVIIKAPATETYKVQEYHLPIYHYLCLKTEEYFFGSA